MSMEKHVGIMFTEEKSLFVHHNYMAILPAVIW
jgi:hypothetical protein